MSGGIMETDVSGKADTVLTTKGDLATWDTARVRKGVSATNYTGLQADSAIADGLTYGATARSTLTGIGDLCASSAANTLTRIPAGATSGHVLTSTGAGSLPTYQAVAAGGGQVELIDSYTATIAELTHQFTFTPALDLAADYSELIIVGNLYGTATLGVGAIRVNGATTTYNNSGGFSWNGVTFLNILDTTGTSIVLFPANTNVASTGVLFNCNLQFMKTGGGGVSCYACHTNTVSDGGIHAGRNSSIMDGTNTNSLAATLSSLTILTAGNWQTGTNITVYGVKLT